MPVILNFSLFLQMHDCDDEHRKYFCILEFLVKNLLYEKTKLLRFLLLIDILKFYFPNIFLWLAL